MTTGDEGEEHQMERRLQWEANAYKGQCNEQRGPKATLPELASMKKNSRLSSDRSGMPWTGVKILPKLWEKIWMRRGGDDDPRRPKRTCSLLSNPPRGERSRHREGHLDGKGPKLRANEAEEGSGATSKLQEGKTGPQGPNLKACLWG